MIADTAKLIAQAKRVVENDPQRLQPSSGLLSALAAALEAAEAQLACTDGKPCEVCELASELIDEREAHARTARRAEAAEARAECNVNALVIQDAETMRERDARRTAEAQRDALARALAHIAGPNRAVRATGANAEDMATFAQAVLDAIAAGEPS